MDDNEDPPSHPEHLYPGRCQLLSTILGGCPNDPKKKSNVVARNLVPFTTTTCTRPYHVSRSVLHAKPKQGSVVDSYRTVSVNCAKCNDRLFRYKKKNGTQSSLVKCYIERIVEDSAGLLAKQEASDIDLDDFLWECPNCETRFARYSLIHGRQALKIVGGKIRMTNK